MDWLQSVRGSGAAVLNQGLYAVGRLSARAAYYSRSVGLLSDSSERHEIDRPIFIIGCPRSGTSFLYRVFSTHPDLAWFSQRSEFQRIPQSRAEYERRNTQPVPIDGHASWNVFCPKRDHYLSEKDLSEPARVYFRSVVGRILQSSRKPRFLNKNPRHSMRIRYLNAIFPDALFIHMLRDGRAVSRSLFHAMDLYQKRWFGAKPKNWRQLLRYPPHIRCAHQWVGVIREINACRDLLGSHRYFEVWYEHFVCCPRAVLQQISLFCGLRWDDEIAGRFPDRFENRNERWTTTFTDVQQADIERVLRTFDGPFVPPDARMADV